MQPQDIALYTGLTLTSGYFYGLREAFVITPAHYIVRITEIYPTPGRIWVNIFNNSDWKGWKSITPN